jgi:two-component system chemotaxis response regulator CheB
VGSAGNPGHSEELPARYCVGIVASAGGVDALSRILTTLPADFPAAIAIVLHIQRNRESHLSTVLSRTSPLPVLQARGGELLRPGAVLVAPPNRHLIFRSDGTTALSDAPPEHFSRPSGNPLFASLAEHYGRHAIAAVLTGYDGDGAEGIKMVKAAGGATLAQNEATSFKFSMPRAAIATGAIDQVVGIDEIGKALLKLVNGVTADSFLS